MSAPNFVQTSGRIRNRQFYSGLLRIAQERGYKHGWAAHKHKEKFGVWPATNRVTAAPPDPAVRSWVKSRQIAYAKGLERRSA